jgi:hypothetical protein
MQLRTVALTVLLTGVTVFVARLAAPRSAAHAPVPALAPKLRELEVRLLEHRTDSIVGADGRTRQPVRLAFPSGRPVVALLYESTCPACQLAESGWADMARRVGDRALIVAATKGEPTDPGFLDGSHVLSLRMDMTSYRRAFGVWEVVPITLAISAQGHVSWVRFGPLDSEAIESLVELLEMWR